MRQFPLSNIQEFGIFKKLNSPQKIQDFLNTLQINFEEQGETYLSPLMVLRRRKAHCIEGAMLAAAILWYHGEPPLLMDFQTARGDVDHVIALFRQEGYWGAISKTNHAVLRYRDPVYKNVRELALSYFNEYFLDNGRKTLRTYSLPFRLLDHDDKWLISERNLWHIPKTLDKFPHMRIVNKERAKFLRRVDTLEINAGKLVEWEKKIDET